jgi:hypothetical protein
MLGDLVLVLWVFLAFWFYSRFHPVTATAMTLIGSSIWLPVGHSFDFPAMPALDRELISTLTALICAFAFASRRLLLIDRTRTLYLLLPAALSLVAVMTGLTNNDTLIFGYRILPSMGPIGAISFGISQLLTYGLPFALGLTLIRTREDLLRVLYVLAGAGLVYTIFVLFELRMSPILHKTIYGHHARSEFDFSMSMRDGGYRPTVFMISALDLGFFMAISGIAGVGIWKAGIRKLGPVPTGASAGWVLTILALCKCFAALLYSACAAPLLALFSGRTVIRVAAAMALIAVTYPVLRSLELFPTERIVETAALAGEDRANSIDIRFTNEEIVLLRAQERLLFGWGNYARWRTYDVEGSFEDRIDGLWLVILGSTGALGLGLFLAILLLPVFSAYWNMGRIRTARDRSLVGVVALILALNGVDLLLNAFLHTFVLFLSGGLASAVPVLCAVPRTRPVERPALRTLRAASVG